MDNAFGQKLRLFMDYAGVKNVSLARALNVDPALVSLWRSGKRTLARDNPLLERLAGYIARQCGTGSSFAWLQRTVGAQDIDAHLDYSRLLARVADWLLAPVDEESSGAEDDFTGIFGRSKVPAHFVGSAGLGEALEQLRKRLAVQGSSPLRVYISSEQSGLVFSRRMDAFWAALRNMSAAPVDVVFEQWRDDDRVAAFLDTLLPHVLGGGMKLAAIRSQEHLFCHNVTVLAPGCCALMILEPAAMLGNSVAIFVEDGDFIAGLGQVFARLDGLARPMVTLGTEAAGNRFVPLFRALQTGEQPCDVMGDGLSPLFMSEESFDRLLAGMRLSAEQRRYRAGQFAAWRAGFWQSLSGRRELISLEALDGLVRGEKSALFGLPLLPVKAQALDEQVARGLLEGLLLAIERCPGFAPRLVKKAVLPRHGCLIGGDRQAVLQSWQGKESRVMHTENWLLVRQLRRLFSDAWQGDSVVVHGREHAAEALRYRLETLV